MNANERRKRDCNPLYFCKPLIGRLLRPFPGSWTSTKPFNLSKYSQRSSWTESTKCVQTMHWIPNSYGFSLTTPGAMCKEASCTSRAAKCVVNFRSWWLWNLLGFKKLISFDSFCKSIQSLGSLCPWQWTFSKISRSQSDKRVVLQNNESTPPAMEAKYLSLESLWSRGLKHVRTN